MQQYSSTGDSSLSVFLAELVQRHLESVLAADEPEPVASEPVKLAGADVEGLIVECSETVKAMAWKFARGSSGVDVDDMYSIGMLAVCEAVPFLKEGLNPFPYLRRAAKNAMIDEWRRIHECSTVSLDAPLSDTGSFTLHDTLPSPDIAVPSLPIPSKRVRALNGAMQRLASVRQRAVLRRRYGLPGYGVHNEKETMRELHTTQPAIDHARRDGLRKLAGDARLCEVMGVEVEP
jgi:DNA-directed RNA polymerase specialized sigma24 family protein